MTGFQHSPAGGNGNLVVSTLQSPNFDPDAGTGWQITRAGDATFYSISLPDTETGTKVTFASEPPAAPDAGDVWYDTAEGLLAQVWNGTAWVPYEIGTGAVSFTAQEIGGFTYTVGPAADEPADPNPGDIWLNSTTSKMFQWNGTSWVQFFYGANSIASGAITNVQIAANAGITGSQLADLTVTVDKFQSTDHYLY